MKSITEPKTRLEKLCITWGGFAMSLYLLDYLTRDPDFHIFKIPMKIEELKNAYIFLDNAAYWVWMVFLVFVGLDICEGIYRGFFSPLLEKFWRN